MKSQEHMISLMTRHVLTLTSNPSRYAEELPPADHPAGQALARIDSWDVRPEYAKYRKIILRQSECHPEKADPTMRDCKVLYLMLGISEYFR